MDTKELYDAGMLPHHIKPVKPTKYPCQIAALSNMVSTNDFDDSCMVLSTHCKLTASVKNIRVYNNEIIENNTVDLIARAHDDLITSLCDNCKYKEVHHGTE